MRVWSMREHVNLFPVEDPIEDSNWNTYVLIYHKYLHVKAIIFIWFTWHQIYAMIATLFHSIKIIATV